MSIQLQAPVSPPKQTPSHRWIRQLEALYPLAFVASPSSQPGWVSDAWQARVAQENLGHDERTSLSDFCRREDFSRVVERLPQEGGLLRARLVIPGSGAPHDLCVFLLAGGPGQSPQSVAIARADEPASRVSERSALLDDTPQPILAVDGDGFVAYANPAAEEFLGCPVEALEGCALAALAVDADGLETLLDAFETRAGEFALTLRGARGEPLDAVVRAAPRGGPNAQARGMVMTLRPDPRGAESELARRNDELEHCVNTVAHDLRSPLVALLGFSRLLRQDFGPLLDETGAHFIDRIEQAGRTMESLIHDLLELSRIGKAGDSPRLVDPRSVLLQLAAELKPRFDAADIRLSLPENPPLLFCDRTRLYQVFSNLIGNALDHMGECEDRRILVSIAEHPSVHQLSVRDFGRGVEAKHVETIFEVFQTVGARRDRRQGTGMGLAIVRKIAETHHGNAWVESHPGQGATFHVTFPRC